MKIEEKQNQPLQNKNLKALLHYLQEVNTWKLASRRNGAIKHFKTKIPHGRRFKNANNQNKTSNPKLGHMGT